MPRDNMCHYGNCHSVSVPLVLTDKVRDERLYFCSLEHLLAYTQEDLARTSPAHSLRLGHEKVRSEP